MRQRVDKVILDRGIVNTREKAKRLILAGQVIVNNAPAEKPGALIAADSSIRLRHPIKQYVGRGGEKLAGALNALKVEVRGLHILDIGASTGGFTDCLLQHGASKVTALDVGHRQLNWKLVSDSRVHIVEGVNARYLRREDFSDGFELVTADVSFISLTKILPAIATLLLPGGHILVLIKPQFELSASEVGRGGVVKDPKQHAKSIENIIKCVQELGLNLINVVPSTILGAAGNQEFFLFANANEK